jgi:hypothetical protein
MSHESCGRPVYDSTMILVRLLLSPVALLLGLLPARLFVPRELDDDEVTLLEGTAHVTWL